MNLSTRAAFSCGLLLLLQSATAVAAQDGGFDDDAETRGLACWGPPPPFSVSNTADDDLVELTTGNADIQPGGDAQFEGPVEIRTQGRLLTADRAEYDSDTGTFTADGAIRFQDQQGFVTGSDATFATTTGRFNFAGAEFELHSSLARGSADAISVLEEGVLELEAVRYTSCPPGNEDWLLKARDIELDTNKGMGTARGASLRFKNVPFLYLPYFTYPISDERKSGLLFPSAGSSDRRGLEVAQPIYWNIAPDKDATFEPRYMSKRGVQLGAETRFLTESSYIELRGDYLPYDNRTATDRWRYEVLSTTALPKGWRMQVDARGVSDDDYYEDLSSIQRLTSRTNLSQELSFEYYGEIWSAMARFQDYQTIDATILPTEEPYQQIPQIMATGRWTKGWLGFDYVLDTEASYFYRDDSVSGGRVHVQPGFSLPIRNKGFYFTPSAELDLTLYTLQDEAAGQDDSPSRAAPIVSIDTGAVFDRYAGNADKYLVTLEPRAVYAYIPFRDQSDLPVFDTIRPDFNLVQLYRESQFIGYDRLSDTNQLSVGITSRVLDSEDGRELLTATLGQTIFLEDSDVVLPGESPSTADSTDYIAEVGVNIWEKWGLDFRYQFDSDSNETARTAVRLRFRPGNFKAVNISYRYARDSLEQTDVSFAWPLGKNWDFIGRYNYSLEDQKALDRFVGVEYGSCCWGISLLARRTISRSTGEADSAVSLQFVLKGFSNVGSKESRNLQRAILEDSRYR